MSPRSRNSLKKVSMFPLSKSFFDEESLSFPVLAPLDPKRVIETFASYGSAGRGGAEIGR